MTENSSLKQFSCRLPTKTLVQLKALAAALRTSQRKVIESAVDAHSSRILKDGSKEQRDVFSAMMKLHQEDDNEG